MNRNKNKIKSRVLIVDDNAKNIQVLANHLKEDGYEVEYASSGKNAVMMVEKEEFDAILLDVMMPGIDGFDTCKRIKALDHRKHIPIIFVTAKTDLDSLTLGFEYGGVDYITKPFKADELLLRVSTHVELKKARDLLSYHKTYLEKKEASFTKDINRKAIELKQQKDNFDSILNALSSTLKIMADVYNESLNNISTPVSLLKLQNCDEKSLELVNQIENLLKSNTDTADFIFKNQKVFTDQEKALTKSKIQPERIIANILSEKASDFRSKSIKLKTDFDSGVEIAADSSLIENTLSSIISNAFKFSNENSEIQITLKESESENNLIIKDQGSGFPKQYILYPFKPIKDENGIYHLSLFFAKYIMDLHGFGIRIGNNPDQGGFVKLTFPK